MGITGKRIAPPRAQGASPIITHLEWNEDLAELPALEFAADLSSGCTEAQALAALSIDSGGLLVDSADAVVAGADVDFEAFWWLTDPVLDPLDMYMRSEWLNAFVSGSKVHLGLFAFYLEDGETVGDPPPDSSASVVSPRMGIARGNDFYVYRHTHGASVGGHPVTQLFSELRTVASRFADHPYSHRAGTSYAAMGASSTIANDSRTDVLNTSYPDAARWRPALGIYRATTDNQQISARLDAVRIQWRPSP